ncbi:MAG: NAD(P)/FAD-dependent oxidoreductase [Acetobacteraceae bacterium]|nr:NAD(P)/FAD-dependent oxidoreductase [Acetobacteraceae bacterium]
MAGGPGGGAAARGRPRVVVVGAGFAGLAAARALASAPVELVVVDQRNHHLFQPLLYQVATAGLSPADIAMPIRSILGRRMNTEVILGAVTGVDKANRRVLLADRPVRYDMLILATGARHAYFGRDDWERDAPGLKRIEDATAIRRRILIAFEQAEGTTDEAERRRLLNFVVVGGGPTGVEMAGAIAELAKVALARDFRRIDPRDARVVLAEAGPRVLPAFPEVLSAKARAALESLGVEVRVGRPVTALDGTGVSLGGAERIEAATIIWAAGVAASAAARWLGAAADGAGRVIVGPDLTLPGNPEIFVLGDTAAVQGPGGKPLPGLAPVAKQQGTYAARLIRARLEGRGDTVGPFRYRDLGSLATIGRGRAVADFGRVRMSRRLAWLLWGVVHIAFLIGFRNRLAVLLDWLWAYVSFKRGARLITAGPMSGGPVG